MKTCLRVLMLWLSGAITLTAQAVDEARTPAVEAAVQAAGAAPVTPAQLAYFVVSGPLPAPPQDVTDLKFREFVRTPVGPNGTELTGRLIGLNGKRVRLVGYMARQTPPTPGMLVLSPLPVDLGDEDESLSDDLPVTATFVHLEAGQAGVTLRYLPGLLQFTGTLNVGLAEEADGHVSAFRLRLDHADSQRLAELGRAIITDPGR